MKHTWQCGSKQSLKLTCIKLVNFRVNYNSNNQSHFHVYIYYFYAALFRRQHYALNHVRLSVSLVSTVNLKNVNHTTFKREVTHVRSNWENNYEVKGWRSRSLGREKEEPQIASQPLGPNIFVIIHLFTFVCLSICRRKRTRYEPV